MSRPSLYLDMWNCVCRPGRTDWRPTRLSQLQLVQYRHRAATLHDIQSMHGGLRTHDLDLKRRCACLHPSQSDLSIKFSNSPLQDDDINEARSLYQANLASVEEALAADPDNADLCAVAAELRASIAEIDEAIELSQRKASSDAVAYPTEGSAAVALTRKRQAPSPGRAPAINSNNAHIHPRSRYAEEEPDFAALAAQHPSLQQHLLPAAPGSARRSIDFTSPAACRELTRVLLKQDFGIEWWIPDGQLVPPLTNRLNYIHWLEDLLSLSCPSECTPGLDPGTVRGLDVGCGANLIYPLLGAAACGWSFVGVDVTPVALTWAHRNRESNPQLAPRIAVRAASMQPKQAAYLAADGAMQTRESGEREETPHIEGVGVGILSGAVRKGETFAFCMCNPPFFESLEEAGRNPATAFGGTAAEMVYPGGELAFVTSMVEDSVRLHGAIHWYTTMVGKKVTLKAVRTLLYSRGVRIVRTTEFFQVKFWVMQRIVHVPGLSRRFYSLPAMGNSQ